MNLYDWDEVGDLCIGLVVGLFVGALSGLNIALYICRSMS